jgi:hypothetical protein
MEDRQEVIRNIARLNILIEDELDKPEEIQDMQALAMFQTQLGAAFSSKSSYIGEHEKLLTKKERLLKDLKGTREQRKRHSEDAKTNFSAWLRQLEDEDLRKKEGYEIEIHRIAADKSIEKLKEFHTFENGEIDQPFLNADTIKGNE